MRKSPGHAQHRAHLESRCCAGGSTVKDGKAQSAIVLNLGSSRRIERPAGDCNCVPVAHRLAGWSGRESQHVLVRVMAGSSITPVRYVTLYLVEPVPQAGIEGRPDFLVAKRKIHQRTEERL